MKDVPVFDGSKYTSHPENHVDDELTKGSLPTSDGLQFENKLNINGCTAIAAQKGMSLLAIATENNIKLSKLLEYNDLEKDGLLEKDQYIFLEKKSREGEKDFYIVQSNETPYDVAQKNGVMLQNLCEYNKISQNEIIYAGTKINLKPGIDNPGQLNEEIISNVAKVHAVQPKEGLYTISKKYGVTVSQIKEWNNLPDDNLKVGQQLIISK